MPCAFVSDALGFAYSVAQGTLTHAFSPAAFPSFALYAQIEKSVHVAFAPCPLPPFLP